MHLFGRMTSRDFCFWLQGFFEITGTEVTKKLTETQVDIVKKHLALVFAHEIDPSAGPPEHQAHLNNIHAAGGTTFSPVGHVGHGGAAGGSGVGQPDGSVGGNGSPGQTGTTVLRC